MKLSAGREHPWSRPTVMLISVALIWISLRLANAYWQPPVASIRHVITADGRDGGGEALSRKIALGAPQMAPQNQAEPQFETENSRRTVVSSLLNSLSPALASAARNRNLGMPTDPAPPPVTANPGGQSVISGPPPGLSDPVTSRPAMSTDAGPGPRTATPGNRWSASGWAFIRGGDSGSAVIATGGGPASLAGSQAGGRLAFRLDNQGRLEPFGRIVTAGRRNDSVEAAVGVAVRPIRQLPMQFVLERRASITGPGGRNAFAAFATGGVNAVAVRGGWRLDGYGAAGMVGLRRRDVFIEGSSTIARPVVRIEGVQFDAGLVAAGGAQPGASRIDVGPSVIARFTPNAAALRLTVDYRARLAGNAVPASGLSFSLAGDF